MKRLPEFVTLFAGLIFLLWSIAEMTMAVRQKSVAAFFFFTLAVLSFVIVKTAWKEIHDGNDDSDALA